MHNKRILVTGGAGFIGYHLVTTLLKQGNRVVSIDNYSSSSKTNIAQLKMHPQLELIEHDIMLPIYENVDEIYNLACPASPRHYQKDPIRTIKTNIFGAINVLELARKIDVKVLHASTSEVYGDPLVHPQNESYWGNVNPIGLRSCYDEGKRCAETLFFDYFRRYGLQIKIIRIFNTYGPYMHPNDGRVVSNFIVQAIKGEDITVYGDGMQTRSFCYIDDLIEGIQCMMRSGRHFPGPVNLGNPAEFTIMELAENVLQLTNSKSKLVFKPLPQDDPKQRKPDISLANSMLSWHPKVSLKDGLRETIRYFRRVL